MLLWVVPSALAVLLAGAAAGVAQDGPAEVPPASFQGQQYVDSRGCAFLRAGGEVGWVARVTPDRKPLCGYPPSLPAPSVAAAPVGETAPAPAADPLMGEAAVAAVAAPAPTLAAQPQRKPERQKARAQRRAPPAGPVESAPVVVRADCLAEVEALRVLTIRPGETVSRADLPARVGCPVETPLARRVPLAGGGSTVVCVRPGKGLDGARAPILPPRDDGRFRHPPAAAPATATVLAADTEARRFVQVGAFAVPANADRARDRLAALGLPVAEGQAGRLEVVLAGPFDGRPALRTALTAARGAGFGDAFIR